MVVLGHTHEVAHPRGALADVVMHQPRDVLVATRGDERLDDEIAPGVAATWQPPADGEEELGYRAIGLGCEEVGEQPAAVCAQSVDEQLRLRLEVRIEGAVADARRGGDVGDSSAVVAPLGEDLGGGAEQPLPGVRGGHAGDPSHPAIERVFISPVKPLEGVVWHDLRVEIWFNPSCSKCRLATEMLDEAGVDYVVRRYLDQPPTAKEIEEALTALGLEPWDITRMGEPEAADLGLADRPHDRQEWIEILAAHPRLIQRPIILTADGGAWVARSADAVENAIAAERE